MKHKFYILSAIDGIIQALALSFIIFYTISDFAYNLSLEVFLLISILGAVLLTGVYLLFLVKQPNNKRIVWFSLGSCCSFSLCMLVLFTGYLTLPFNPFPMREINSADGILILFVGGYFVISSVILRLSVFVAMFIKNRIAQTSTGSTGDGLREPF